MSRMTKARAKTLAVAYHAYLEATNRDDDNGVCVWGDMLIEAQDACGVEMLPKASIRFRVKAIRAQRNQAAIAA